MLKRKYIYRWIILTVLTMSFNSVGSEGKYRVGDFVLLPMNCSACLIISDEINSPYSHLGIILSIKNQEVILAEAYGKVRLTTLMDFKKRLIPGKKLGFYRLREWNNLFRKNQYSYNILSKGIVEYYQEKFHGLPYDDEFLWSNFDTNGDEKLYCSEFITKLINPFLKKKLGVHPMNYLRNWDFWVRYMGKNPPQGKPGNNPSFFTDKSLFQKIQ